MTLESTFVDERGYRRFVKNKRLVHRQVYYQAFPGTDYRWHVHHINGKKGDNRLENLIALEPSKHKRLHEYFSLKDLPQTKEETLSWLKAYPRGRKRHRKKIKHTVRPKTKRKIQFLKRPPSKIPEWLQIQPTKKIVIKVINGVKKKYLEW